MVNPASLLTDLSPYVYGTTRLGDDKIPFEERVRMARAAMDAGCGSTPAILTTPRAGAARGL